MGYYMRFVSRDTRRIDLATLEEALRAQGPQYVIERDGPQTPCEQGLLRLGSEILGEIEINRPGDGLFVKEIEELKDFLGGDVNEGRDDALSTVTSLLDDAKEIVAVRVLFQGREAAATMEMIDPLWSWLYQNREGLLRADAEGYYDELGPVLLGA